MPNRLAQETSPYLLQHADNPVDWFPWGQEALDKAQTEDKPIFLSIGYAACHWCHVMAHESFEDPRTASLLNQDFVAVKVDREERPDIDQVYMNAVVAMNGQGGWPLSVFLTPDARPFFGGTYFPKDPRAGMPSFTQVLESLTHTWHSDRQKIDQAGDQLADYVRKVSQVDQSRRSIQPETLEKSTQILIDSYDRQNGGWGSAPKFPQPMAVEFLLRQATRGNTAALDTARHALDAMSRGGMYDVIGGGFHRYSTDDRWLIPHFEKMLYDNALLSSVYLHAYLLTKEERYREVCEDCLDFVSREMTHPQGGFFSSLDADSEGVEGKFYVWSLAEIESILGDPQDVELLSEAYGLNGEANFEGQWVLQRARSDAELAERFDITSSSAAARIKDLHLRLLQHRDKRPRPGTDDKILVSWNALMLRAFAEAGMALDKPEYIEAARKNTAFLLAKLRPGDRLLRTWRDGDARLNAYLDDYGALIVGLCALYAADPQPAWMQMANLLTDEMLASYRDPLGGFFDTRTDHVTPIVRPKELQDNATPSGNALASYALLVQDAYTENTAWRDAGEELLGSVQSMAARYPTAFGFWLSSLDFAVGPVRQVAILGASEDPRTRALVRAYTAAYRPRSIIAISDAPAPNAAPALLHERPLIAGAPTAYVCENFTCRLPVNEPSQLAEQLDQVQS